MKRFLKGLVLSTLALLLLVCPLFQKSAVAAEPNTVVLDECDLGGLWTAKSDSLNKKQGMASLKMSQKNVWFEARFFDVDTSSLSYDTAYLEFWFLIEDVSIMQGDGQIELTSVNRQDDDNEIHWPAGSVSWKNGWNFVSLKLSDAVKAGEFDFSKINFFRFYQFTTGDAEVWIDYLVLTDTPTVVDQSELGMPEGGIVRESNVEENLSEEDKARLEQNFLNEVIERNKIEGNNQGYYTTLVLAVCLFLAASVCFAAGVVISVKKKKNR
ncbi:MAG: hypothetical protein IJY62_00110 [Clostridia bacterium]|nr:hypothetical protein [Clostridia bacterium]